MSENITIVVVDDEPDIVNLAKQFLLLGGFNVITCFNGKEALEIVEEKHETISLMLLDIMMPGISGFDVLTRIKNNDKHKHIIVILFTVRSFAEDIQKGKKLGADGYMPKPFSGKELVKYIQDKLGLNK